MRPVDAGRDGRRVGSLKRRMAYEVLSRLDGRRPGGHGGHGGWGHQGYGHDPGYPPAVHGHGYPHARPAHGGYRSRRPRLLRTLLGLGLVGLLLLFLLGAAAVALAVWLVGAVLAAAGADLPQWLLVLYDLVASN